jgi:hypothetical protein
VGRRGGVLHAWGEPRHRHDPSRGRFCAVQQRPELRTINYWKVKGGLTMTRRRGSVLATAIVTATTFVVLGCPGVGKMAGPAKEPTRAISDLTLPSTKSSRFLTGKHFVTSWLVLGPFKFKETDFKGDQQQEATDHEFMRNEGCLDGTQKAPKGTSWQEKDFKGDFQAGRIDLDALYDKAEYAAAYAVAWLHCPERIADAKLLVGSDDYIKVWVNGKLVHTYKEKRRASEWDQDTIEKITLEKGFNHVVVKCVDVVFDWDFYLRLTDKSNRPITVKARKPEAAATK